MEKQQAKWPDLVWQTIFKFLEYDDLLNLKKIYGELKDLVSLYVESKTVVVNQGKERYDRRQSKSSHLVSKSLIRFRMNSDMHLSVKRLVLYNPVMLFNLKNLDNLIQLKIQSTANFKRPNRILISLKNLEKFEALISDCKNVSIVVLEAPKLSDFFIDFSLEKMKIIHPHSIKTACSPRIRPIVKQMVNLETLETVSFKISDAGSFFGDLKRLKQFSFYLREDGLIAINEHLRSALSANPNLSILYKRIDFNSNPLQDAELNGAFDDRLDDKGLRIYQKYTDAVDGCLIHSELQIQDFRIPSVELIRKLTFLENLQVLGDISDGEKWCELLKLPKLSRLTIRSALEDQLAQIPEHCPFVSFVEIASFERGDWLLRLNYLEEFRTGAVFDFELLKKMIQQLYHLKLVKVESYEIKIENATVECISNGDLVLSEPKPVFLQTIELVNLWSELFYSEFE